MISTWAKAGYVTGYQTWIKTRHAKMAADFKK
jgi:hypothetical protein